MFSFMYVLIISLQQYDWCNDTHWVEHSITNIPDPAGPPPTKKSRRSSQISSEPTSAHKTGSARTEGNAVLFYRLRTDCIIQCPTFIYDVLLMIGVASVLRWVFFKVQKFNSGRRL